MRMTSALVLAVLVMGGAQARKLADHHIEFMNAVLADMAGCRQGEPDACLRLGDRFEYAQLSPLLSGSIRHHLRAWLYRFACDAGNARGCHHLGMLISNENLPELGVGGSAYRRRRIEQRRQNNRAADAHAARLHTRACDAGLAAACQSLWSLKLLGFGGPRDREAADAALRKACDVDATDDSCARLGATVIHGMDAEILAVPSDPAERAEYLRAACEHYRPACRWLADD